MSDSGDKRVRASAVITVHKYEPAAYDERAAAGADQDPRAGELQRGHRG